MIQLLFSLLFLQGGVVFLLLVKTPLRKLAILGLDRVKRGRGPVVVKTIAGTMLVVFASSIYSMVKIQKRTVDFGAPTPTDQILMSRHLLESSLIGFSIFLALTIDRLHHYMRELRAMRKGMEAVKKQSRGFEDGKGEELKSLAEEIVSLKAKVKQLELEAETKDKDINTAEANVLALRKQTEGLLLQYDRLSKDNQNLRDQLKSIDQRVSHSDSKKNM